MQSLMHIENLSVGYGKKSIVTGASLTVNRGEMLALIGRNGTGKTTLLKSLAGIQKPLGGKILINEKNLYALTARERASLVSIVLTNRISLQGINVRTLLEMGRYPSLRLFPFLQKKNEAEVNKLVNSCMTSLGISELANKPLAQISDGELQKAMIARSLVQQTPLILMDEPTAFLDYIAKEELFAQLKKLVNEENISILFSSHDIALVKKYSDRIIRISEGKLAEENPVTME